MRFKQKFLQYQSRIDETRRVRKKVVDVQHLSVHDAVMTIEANTRTLRVVGNSTFTPRRAYPMHLDRRTGEVWYFRPQCAVEDVGLRPNEDKILVGINGTFA